MNGLEMMKGTGGEFNYLVMGRTKGFIIGVKPIFEDSGNKTFIGMRIRMMFDEVSDTEILHKKQALLDLFPKIPWQVSDDKRVSLVGGAVVGINHTDTKAIQEWFVKETIPVVLFGNIKSLFPGMELTLKPLFIDYYTECFLDNFKVTNKPKGDGSTVISMFQYKKELNKPDANPDDDIDYTGNKDGEG